MAHTVLFRGAISVYSFRHFQHTRRQALLFVNGKTRGEGSEPAKRRTGGGSTTKTRRTQSKSSEFWNDPRDPNREPRTPNREPGTPNRDPRDPNLEPRTASPEPRTANLEPRTANPDIRFPIVR